MTFEKTARKATERAQRRAAQLVAKPALAGRLATRALDVLIKSPGALLGVAGRVRVLVRLVQAWARRDYTRVPTAALVTIVGALLYLVMPADAIPDFIPVLGFVDDAWVLGIALDAVQRELDAFEAWETSSAPDVRPSVSAAAGTPRIG